MKIGNPTELLRTTATAGGAAASDADKAKGSASVSQLTRGSGSATVKLSGDLAKMKANATTDGAFDAERVERLKAPIANGTFGVNVEIVADKVIASNLEALMRSKP